jgi:HNH/Endo VII superfamily nuclease toxin with a HHH motif
MADLASDVAADRTADLSVTDKIGEAMRRSLPLLPGEAQGGVLDMLKPENLAIIGAAVVVWAASQFFGVGEFVDFILLVIGIRALGFSVLTGARELYYFVTTAVNATSSQDLDVAGQHFAQAVLILGISVVQAVLLRGAANKVVAPSRPQVKPRIPDTEGIGPKGVTSEPFGPPSPADAAKAAAASRPANATRLGVTRTNAADWRDLRDWWDQGGYGEILSESNRALIAKGKTPIVDDAWIKVFPEDAGLAGEKISMHHIGGNPITVPLPATRHLDAHMPGGFRYNPGGPGGSAPFYPADK